MLKLLALIVVWLLFATRPAWAQKEPLEFNFGLPNADHITIFVAQELGLFEKVGLRPKFYMFSSGAPLLAGLKSESLGVAQADYEGIYLKRPTFAQQIDPSSPYSITARDGGLAQKLFIAGQALFEAGSIPRPVPLTEIQQAIDATYLQAYTTSRDRK